MRKTLTIALSLWLYQFAVCGDLDAWNNGTNATINVGIGQFNTKISLATDVILVRDAANTLALRNGANAQTFNLYNTYTDASNYARTRFYWAGSSLVILPEAAGTGVAGNLILGSLGGTSIAINSGGAARWEFNQNGYLVCASDNAYDIGASGASRPRVIYAGTGVTSPKFTITGTTNQVIFGSTNTAPVSSAAPTKWISVQVSGESTVYRLPLYE